MLEFMEANQEQTAGRNEVLVGRVLHKRGMGGDYRPLRPLLVGCCSGTFAYPIPEFKSLSEGLRTHPAARHKVYMLNATVLWLAPRPSNVLA